MEACTLESCGTFVGTGIRLHRDNLVSVVLKRLRKERGSGKKGVIRGETKGIRKNEGEVNHSPTHVPQGSTFS
jgi:hypothetical protein